VDPKKQTLVTELLLAKSDCENYEFKGTSKSELTFCLKEMKAILAFCEKQNQTVSMFADCEGKPVLISLGLPSVFEADFVLATLVDTSTSGEPSGTSEETTATSQSQSHSQSSSQVVKISLSDPRLSNSQQKTPNSQNQSVLASTNNKRRAESDLKSHLEDPDQLVPSKRRRIESNEEDQDEAEEEEGLKLWNKDFENDTS